MNEAWSQIECELIVKDYMEMLSYEFQDETYNKAEHRRRLIPQLSNRTEGSVEFKHQNISAILVEQGYPYIPGYKPAFNYQGLLAETVVAYLTQHHQTIDAQADKLIESKIVVPQVPDWQKILSEAPEYTPQPIVSSMREFQPRHYNFGEREARNRKLGESGEALVLAYEQHRLTAAGREDLAKETEWTSKVRGDGAGYDIRSFDETQDQERFIEVKTTHSGKYQPFMISENEVAFSVEHPDQYALYRVYQMRKDPRLFMLYGRIGEHVNLSPSIYRASFS